MIKRICVFCGSKTGDLPAYTEQAQLLGKALAKKKIGLVFGGGRIGLMGALADAVLEYGGEAHGVIPEHLMRAERAHPDLTALHITKSMHERKALMAELADAFIALPGGFGTFEELFETITWVQLGIHNKPIVVLNVDGYYDRLIEFVEEAVSHGFITNSSPGILKAVSSIEEALEVIGVKT